MIRLLFAALMTLATTAQAETVRLAVTTSFQNSGLSDVMLPQIKADTGLVVELLVVGTGQALRLGEAGDVDAILVHSKAAEEEFVAAGFGTHRREIMYNDFVVIGPASDPADVTNQQTAAASLKVIAATQAPFVSRGDNSGTHKKERALWQATGLLTEDLGDWYKEVGAGMGAALNTAAGLDAYILSDRASWLNFGNKRELAMLFAGDPALFNQYAFIPVNSALQPHVNAQAVATLENWLVSDAARAVIAGYTINGETLFTFGAP